MGNADLLWRLRDYNLVQKGPNFLHHLLLHLFWHSRYTHTHRYKNKSQVTQCTFGTRPKQVYQLMRTHLINSTSPQFIHALCL